MKRWKADLGLCVVGALCLLAVVLAGGAGVPATVADDGVTNFTGLSVPVNATNFGLPSVVKTSMGTVITTGVSTDIAYVPANQTWLVHSVLANVKTNYDCTGDDCTFVVGDANDADGYLVLADAAMQAADTEGTGWAAGWQGMAAAEIGVYLDDNNNDFVVAASTTPITITATASEASGDTMAAGAADVYVTYTRIK